MRSQWVPCCAVLALGLLAGCDKLIGSKPDVDGLVAKLRSPRADVRGEAGLKLIEIGEPAAPAVAVMLADPDPAMRHLGATTLWSMGAKASPAVPQLTIALSDASVEVRSTAAMALEQVGPPAAPAVAALTKALSDTEGTVRREAARALGSIGPAAASAVPALVQASRNDYMSTVANEAVRKIQSQTSR
jgi:HEAT repeat protein